MVGLPDDTMRVVNNPKSSKTIATRSSDGRIHTIWMGSLMALSPDELTFAHILMKRTQKNLEEMKGKGEPVSVSVTLGQSSYEIMAKVGDYQTSGSIYDRMIEELTKLGVMENLEKFGMKVLGIWILEPEEVWIQGPGPNAGTRVS